jgi:hypothetical protein
MQYRSLGMIALPAAVGLVAGLGAAAPVTQPRQDSIEVAGHVAVGSGPVTRLMATQHYGKYYVYAEHAGSRAVTLIDVTKIGSPAVIADLNYPQNARDGLVAVAGTAAVVEDQPGPSVGGQRPGVAAATPRSIKLMDFSDKEHPKVEREFTGVTAISRDNQRGLIFLANADGVWILQQKLAEDPAMVQAYNNYLRYNK